MCYFWRPSLVLLVSSLAVIVLSGCGQSSCPSVAEAFSPLAAPTGDNPAESQPPLRPIALGAASPAHSVGTILLAAQPAPAEIPQWKARGIRTVVTLRKPDEIDWDEQAAVEAEGMDFVALPFQSGEELTDEIFDEVRELLGDPARQPLVLHCGAAVRVGAVWLPYRVLDQGVPAAQALAEARQVGLHPRFLIERAQAYLDKHQPAAPEIAAESATAIAAGKSK